jgi:hypothetical protein
MKLTTTTFVSVDGMMQGIGGPDEDRSGGFERGGWTVPHFTTRPRRSARPDLRDPCRLLGSNGRSGRQPHRGGVEHAAEVRGIDHTHRPAVANTTVLSSEVAAAVGELRAKPGRELQVHGSRTLIRWLLDNDLVDEITRLTFPVVVGQGTRLFPDTGPDTALELVESRATPSGVTIQVYRPTGRPQYGTATVDMKHVK